VIPKALHKHSDRGIAALETARPWPQLRCAGFLLLALCLICAPQKPASAADTDAELKRASDSFQYGNYADAATIVEARFKSGRLTTDQDLIEAYRVLGLSYYYLGRIDDARSQILRLLSVDPNYVLDPFFHPPKLVEFFDQVRADNESLLTPLREQRARQEADKARAEALREKLLDEETRRQAREELEKRRPLPPERVELHSPLINWLPFGAGQYQNGQKLKGGFITAGAILSGGASTLSFLIIANLKRCEPLLIQGASLGQPDQSGVRCGVPAESQSLAQGLVTLKWSAGLAFFAIYIYGVIDAHLFFEPELRLRPQASPAAAAPALSARILPWASPEGLGASLQLRF